MFRYQIKIEYDGTDFVGWQYQKNGKSIQGVLQKILLRFFKKKIIVVGSGRTDSGVHAIEQSAHIDLEKKILEKKKISSIIKFLLKKLPYRHYRYKRKGSKFSRKI